MPGNRVEELEATVSELESTVTGLTEERVEAKERIRDLEAELEPDPADGSQFPQAEPEEVKAAASRAEETAADVEEPVDRSKNEPPESEDETAESESGDDIIIA